MVDAHQADGRDDQGTAQQAGAIAAVVDIETGQWAGRAGCQDAVATI